jgi:hypothetical protein
MRGNINEADRILRIFLGVILVAVGLTYEAGLVPVGIATILTGIIGWCPLYAIARISTREVNEEQTPRELK